MGQTHKVRGVATSIRTEAGKTKVRYHNTDVVTFDDKEIVLDTGNWYTVTTKVRMNQASNQYGLGYSVFKKDGFWHVVTQRDGKVHTFGDDDKLTLKRG
jgi:hypothetical protein